MVPSGECCAWDSVMGCCAEVIPWRAEYSSMSRLAAATLAPSSRALSAMLVCSTESTVDTSSGVEVPSRDARTARAPVRSEPRVAALVMRSRKSRRWRFWSGVEPILSAGFICCACVCLWATVRRPVRRAVSCRSEAAQSCASLAWASRRSCSSRCWSVGTNGSA